MSAMTMLWTSILLGGVAQILLKCGVTAAQAGASGKRGRWWLGLLTSGWMWSWAAAFTAATALWLLAVSQLSISFAFPLLSAGYVLVAILSRIFLGERVSWKRWTAIAVICAGVILISRQ
jgi:drug/metabolite transporter (DMT)-like permease